MLAKKLGVGVDDVQDLVIWGNHSPTMFPDLFNAKVNGRARRRPGRQGWYENEYIPKVGKRGAAIIEARGASSAASAANAAIDHVRDWVLGADGLRSMAVRSDGAGTASRRASSPRSRCGSRAGPTRSPRASTSATSPASEVDRTVQELKEERDAVQQLGLLG